MADHNYTTDTYDANTAVLDECKKHIAEVVLPSEPASQFGVMSWFEVNAINSILGQVSQFFETSSSNYTVVRTEVVNSDDSYSSKLSDSVEDIGLLGSSVKSMVDLMTTTLSTGVEFLSDKNGEAGFLALSKITEKIVFDIKTSKNIRYSFDETGFLTSEAIKDIHGTFMKDTSLLTEDDGVYITHIVLAINNQRISNPEAYKKNLSSFINSGYVNPKDRPRKGGFSYEGGFRHINATGAEDLLALIQQYNDSGPHGGFGNAKFLNGFSLYYIYDYSELSNTYKALISTIGNSLECGDEIIDTVSMLEYTVKYYSKVEHRIHSKGSYGSFYSIEQLQEIANYSNANIQITSTKLNTTDINGDSKKYAHQGTVYHIDDTSPYKDNVVIITDLYSTGERSQIDGHDYNITYYSSDCSNVTNYNGTVLTDVMCAEYRESKKKFDRAGSIAKAVVGEIPFIGGICKAAVEYSEDQEVKAGTVIDPAVKTGEELVSKISETASAGKHVTKSVITSSKLISKGTGFVSTGIDIATDVYDGYKEVEKKNSELDEKIKEAKELNAVLGAVEAHITDYTESGTEYAGYSTTAFIYDDGDKKDANEEGVLVDINVKCRRYDENEVHEYILK